MAKKKVAEPEPEEDFDETFDGPAEDAPAEEVAEEVVPVLGEHIMVDMSGSGVYELLPAPEGWMEEKPRRLTISGQNVEHVEDHLESGVWCYRRM